MARARGLSSLRTLELSDNQIGDRGIGALAHSELTTELEELNLSRNAIADAGAMSLAEAHWPRLTYLNLKGNHIGARGAAALRDSPSLKYCRVLI